MLFALKNSLLNFDPNEQTSLTNAAKSKRERTMRRAEKKNTDNDLKIGTNNSKWKKHHSRDEPHGHPTLLGSCSGIFSKREPRKELEELFLTLNGGYNPGNARGCSVLMHTAGEFQIGQSLPEKARC